MAPSLERERQIIIPEKVTVKNGLQIECLHSIHDVDATDWNRLESGDFIFADHRFLSTLEDSGSLGHRTGWYPIYLVHRKDCIVQSALLLYLKSNSYGEYIFDWSWANAAHRSGLSYYPKLVSAVPFTPATGPKFLIHPNADSDAERAILAEAAREVARISGSQSLHFLFTTESENSSLASEGFLARHSYQYHWQNQGWKTFDGFLSSLRSKRRSEIRREREAAAHLPLSVVTLTGSQIETKHADWMYDFYTSTTFKMGGHAYLTREFFRLLFERLRENIVLILAFDRAGDPVAGALNLAKGQTLFGRYWGCIDEYRNLHFEVCYYRTIEWAIANGVQLFEAGAQGEHKFNRGFTPRLTLSAHELSDPQLSEAISDFIESEKQGIAELFAEYKAHDPFKRD